MANILPYDSLMGLFMQAVPTYEWEPVAPSPPPAEPAAGCEGAAPGGDGSTAGLPAMRLVFKGVRWVAVPTWTMRENPYFDLLVQDERDQDKLRTEARKTRPTVPAPPPAGGTPAAEG